MPSNRKGDYEVGYGKPPSEHRFKKGNKANPRGRPRGSKNLATLLRDALDMPVVDENGAPGRMTKRDMVIAQLVDLSAKADLRATKMLLDMLDRLERRADPVSADGRPEDKALERLRAKLTRLALADAPDADPPTAPANAAEIPIAGEQIPAAAEAGDDTQPGPKEDDR
jgi:hypothetical protein